MRTLTAPGAAPPRRRWSSIPPEILALALLSVACPSGQGSREASQPAAPAPAPGAVPAGMAGRLAAQQGDLDGAEPLLLQGLAETPDDPRLLEALGYVYAHSDRWQKAQETYERLLVVRPGHAGALYGLASVLTDTGRYPEALEATRRFLAADPGNRAGLLKEALLLVRTGDPVAGEAKARALVAVAPDQAEAHYVLGLALEARGDLAGARAALERAVALQPGHLGALARLQTVLTRLGRTEEAATIGAAHREALARQRVEERVRGHRVRGVDAFNRQDYAAALEEFAVIEREDPKDPQVHLYKGSALLALGRRPEARTALLRSLELQPRNERALMELGRLEALDDRLDAAVEALRRAIAINPEFAEPHYFLAGILQAQGDGAGSAAEMRTFRELKARSPAAAM
ncbi:MAG TPA: tetratricopeptide repeat protein, partial [Candidatus Polarisedimenticolia bacterium]|nr:tetratricopeptide repeat protein [Candidatus Polarisedimenticolia bacterium]